MLSPACLGKIVSLFKCQLHAADALAAEQPCTRVRTASRVLDRNALDRDPGETAGADRPLGLVECGFSTCRKHGSFEGSLCLSRACLGKMIGFSLKSVLVF